MDFTFTEEQETIAKVARQLFEHRAAPEHLTELEAGDVRYDADLWQQLATADLLGISLPDNIGGSGHGFLELALLLTEVGWSVAPVPVYATLLLGADTIARYGDTAQQQRYLADVIDGTRLLTAALTEPGRSDPARPVTTARRDGDRWRLDGTKDLVPAAQIAHTMLIPALVGDGDVGVFLLDATVDGVVIQPAETTNGEPHADVTLSGAAVSDEDRLPANGRHVLESLHARALVGLCAIQLDVTERALRIAAAYTTEREQFGRPIGAFRPSNSGWPMPSSMWKPSGGPCGRPPGCSAGAGHRAARPRSRNSGQPKPVRGSPRPPNRCTAASASTPPIPCSDTFCGPSTMS